MQKRPYLFVLIGLICVLLVSFAGYVSQPVYTIPPQSPEYAALMRDPQVAVQTETLAQQSTANAVFFGDFHQFGSGRGTLYLPYLAVESGPVSTAGTVSWSFSCGVLPFGTSGRMPKAQAAEFFLSADPNTSLGPVLDSAGQILTAEWPGTLSLEGADLPLTLDVHVCTLDSAAGPDAEAMLQVSWSGYFRTLGHTAVPFSVSGAVPYQNNVT